MRIATFAALLLSASSAYAVDTSRNFGPFICDLCIQSQHLGSPIPNNWTEQKLSDVRFNIPGGVNVGDTIEICNNIECVIYTMNSGNTWRGAPPTERLVDSGGGGGEGHGPGGSAGSGGGGAVGGSGSWGSGIVRCGRVDSPGSSPIVRCYIV